MKKYITIRSVLLIIFMFMDNPICISQGIWTYYTDELPGVVFDMTQDKNGNYWFATDNGVCQLDTNGQWYYLVDSTAWDSTMYFKNQIVVDKQNNKWFVGVAMSNPTKEFVVKYDDSTFTYYNPSGEEEDTWIQCLGVDSSGYIWAGSMANWAYWFDGATWQSFYVPGTTIYDPITEFGVDRKGKLFIGHTNGISTLDGYIWGGFTLRAYNFSFDKQNRLWFGTNGWGLGVFDGLHWSQYTTNDGLLSNFTGVAIDSNYVIWVTYDRPAKVFSKYDEQNWEHINLDRELIGDYATPMYVDFEGAIWFRSVEGLSVFLDTTTTKVQHQPYNSSGPKEFTLFQNYPNPFNSITMIKYELLKEQNIKLSIFNLEGKEVINLCATKQEEGMYQISWNGKDKNRKEVSSGVYIYILKSGSFTQTKKMTLIR